MDVKSMCEGYREEIIKRLGELVSINSEQSEAEADAPLEKVQKKHYMLRWICLKKMD